MPPKDRPSAAAGQAPVGNPHGSTAIAPVGLIDGRGTTRAQSHALQARILEILREQHPLSIRQAYYQALDSRRVAHVAKTTSGYRKIQRLIRDMRRAGKIPWSWIVDETRETHNFDWGVWSYDEFAKQNENRFCLEFWAPRIGRHIEIWCETRGFEATVARPIGARWRINTQALAGQSSDTLLAQSARRINLRRHPTLVLYCGDLDPHGLQIEEAPRRKLRKYWDCDPEWMKVLVSPDQIESYNLPTDETGRWVQCEAFRKADAQALLTMAINEFASEDDLRAHIRHELAIYEPLREAARQLDLEYPHGFADCFEPAAE